MRGNQLTRLVNREMDEVAADPEFARVKALLDGEVFEIIQIEAETGEGEDVTVWLKLERR